MYFFKYKKGIEISTNNGTHISIIDSVNDTFLLRNNDDICMISYKDKSIFNKIKNTLLNNPKVLVLNNVLSFLDYDDKQLIIKLLEEYKKNGGIIINITSNIEETLISDRIIIIHDERIVCDGKTLSVLNEEKLLKRLGIGLPFIIELNKYFMDYGLINKYYLDNKKLVGALWK